MDSEDGALEYLLYHYSHEDELGDDGRESNPKREQGFVFEDGLLSMVLMESSFPEDSTKFSDADAKRVSKGMTKNEVESLIGDRFGTAETRPDGTSYMFYSYRWYDSENRVTQRRRLQLEFDHDEVVQRISLLEDTPKYRASVLE